MEWYKEDADIFNGEKEDSKWLCEVVWGRLPPKLIHQSQVRHVGPPENPIPTTITITRETSDSCHLPSAEN